MVEIIAENLLNNVMVRDDYRLSLTLADKLLKLIEQAGMRPPAVSFEIAAKLGNGNIRTVNTWEPEDET
jgi:hypothetical protein